jgi:hypothetical protein
MAPTGAKIPNEKPPKLVALFPPSESIGGLIKPRLGFEVPGLQVVVRTRVAIRRKGSLHFCKYEVMTPFREGSYRFAVAKRLQIRVNKSQESAFWS